MKKLLLAVFTILSIGNVLAQNNVRYQGRVISEGDNQPLMGASVIVRGTSIGATTNAQGDFTLSGPKDAILQIKYAGHVPREVKGIPDTRITVRMAVDVAELDEVVVVG